MSWRKYLFGLLLISGCDMEYELVPRQIPVEPPIEHIEPDTTPPIDTDTDITEDTTVPSAEIEVTPQSHYFGDCLLECPVETVIEIKSVGELDLIVDKLHYSGPSDLVLDVDYISYGGLPWILTPGESVFVTIEYSPESEDYHLGYLTVESSDLTDPVVIVGQDGDGIRHGTQIDEFTQEEQIKLDILFVIDNSCSMSDEQTELSLNSDLFLGPLSTSGADFHIGTITTDDTSLRGPVITPSTPDMLTELQDQFVAGTSGDATEKGLEMAAEALQPGAPAGDGGSFFRDDANLVVIIVSDEDDYSTAAVSDYISDMESTKDLSITTFSLHAVAGTLPISSCADEAYRYDQAVTSTSGQFFDICTSDWGYQVEQMAEDSLMPILRYNMSRDPIIDSIEVYIDGAASYTGWYYDAAENAIIFDLTHVPAVDSVITIEYGFYGECPT